MTFSALNLKILGASEENIRDLFAKAYRTAPSIVFIDEIDAIASKRENLQREMERRIVTQLLTCMDESHRLVTPSDKHSDSEVDDKTSGYVLVIGATNRPDAVDSALRRPGRFDREIALGVPDEDARLEILSIFTRNLRLAGDFDLKKIAKATPGFVGADLVALANKAGNLSMQRIIDQRQLQLSRQEGELIEEWWKEPWSPEEMKKLSITMTDFEVTWKPNILFRYYLEREVVWHLNLQLPIVLQFVIIYFHLEYFFFFFQFPFRSFSALLLIPPPPPVSFIFRKSSFHLVLVLLLVWPSVFLFLLLLSFGGAISFHQICCRQIFFTIHWSVNV